MKHTPSSFDPDALDVLHRAYLEALDELNQSSASADDSGMEDVRTTLAKRIVGLAETGERNLETLKRYALKGVHPAARAATSVH